MANIPRAPFFVPRPAEDQLWSRGPISNRGLIDLCTTELKWYGAPGQVPTKQWNSFYTFDDPPVWYWPPQSSDVIVQLTHQLLYGAGGQVREKRWSTSYTFDDPSVWYAAPVHSSIIPLLTFQTFFGKGGQVPTKQWHYDFDDNSSWLFPWDSRNILTATTTAKPIFNQRRWDHDVGETFWQGKPLYASPIPMLTVGGQLQSHQWLFGYDDAAYWVNKPNSDELITLLTVGGQLHTKQWHYDFDDNSYWQQPPQHDLSLTTVTVAAPFKINQQQFGYDDSSIWSLTTQYNLSLTTITAAISGGIFYVPKIAIDDVWSLTLQHDLPLTNVVAAPFTLRQWPFGYDDPSVWLSKPTGAAPIPMLTVGGIIKAKQWRWDYDVGESFWNIPSKSSAAIPLLTFSGIIKAKQWHWDNDDPSVWWDWINKNSIIATVQLKPFLPIPWRFNNDDPPPWQQPAQRSIGLPFVPSISNRWRLDPADDQLWSLTARHNLILATPIQPFVVRWRLDTPDDQPWLSASRRDLPLIATPFSVRPYAYTVDDFTVWQWPGQRSILSVKNPSIQNRWRLDVPDDQLWWLTTQIDLSLKVAPTVTPFTVHKNNIYSDDQAVYSWQWLVKNPIILSLKWNINFERIANTVSEKRIVAASAEIRTAPTTQETRTANTKPETRTAQTMPETRIATAPDEDKLP